MSNSDVDYDLGLWIHTLITAFCIAYLLSNVTEKQLISENVDLHIATVFFMLCLPISAVSTLVFVCLSKADVDEKITNPYLNKLKFYLLEGATVILFLLGIALLIYHLVGMWVLAVLVVFLYMSIEFRKFGKYVRARQNRENR